MTLCPTVQQAGKESNGGNSRTTDTQKPWKGAVGYDRCPEWCSGVGEERFLRVFDRYTELLEEYGGFEADDVADEMLSRRVKQILPKSFTKLYSE